MAKSPELIGPGGTLPASTLAESSIRLYVSQEDVREAERYGVDNPVIFALQQATSTLWRISDCGVALEVTPPYRSCVIPTEIWAYLRDYQTTGFMPECEFEVELQSGSSKNHSG